MNLLLTGNGNSMTNAVTELFKSDSSAVLCSSEGSSTANLSAVKVLTAHAIYCHSNEMFSGLVTVCWQFSRRETSSKQPTRLNKLNMY